MRTGGKCEHARASAYVRLRTLLCASFVLLFGFACCTLLPSLSSLLLSLSLLLSQNSFEKAQDWVKELQQQGDANVVVAFVGNKCDMANQRKVPLEVCWMHIAHWHSYAQNNAQARTHLRLMCTHALRRTPTHMHSYVQPHHFHAHTLIRSLIRTNSLSPAFSLSISRFQQQQAQQYADESGLFYMETSAKTATNVSDLFMRIGKKGKRERREVRREEKSTECFRQTRAESRMPKERKQGAIIYFVHLFCQTKKNTTSSLYFPLFLLSFLSSIQPNNCLKFRS